MTDATDRQPIDAPPSKWRQFWANWQEMLLWMPGFVLLTLLAVVVLGAFPGVGTLPDTLAMLGSLPALCCYAMAACAFSWLFMRNNVFLIRRRELADLWRKAGTGQAGAWSALLIYLGMWLCVLLVFAWFFYPAR